MTEFNAKVIAALPVPEKGNKFHWFPDAVVQGKPIPRGLGVTVTAGGVRSFALNYRINAIERRYTIGRVSDWSVPMAIERARELRREIDTGNDPLAARKPVKLVKEPTIAELFDQWAASPARKDKANTGQVSSFKNHIIPAVGKVPYRELRKGRVADLHDAITLGAGPVAANRAVSYLGAVLSWKAGREDDYTAPSFKGILQGNKEAARERVLKDDEIAKLWALFEASGDFGRIARLLLLTGQRKSDVADLTWDDIDLEARTATVPKERYKTGVKHVFALSAPALAILQAIPRRTDGRVFPVLNSRYKQAVDVKAELPHWTLHDVRRTAKTLMQRAGVLPHISERVLCHAQGRIEATYDHHDYLADKRHAADALAATLERIVSPPAANVVTLTRKT
jgi:integrase